MNGSIDMSTALKAWRRRTGDKQLEAARKLGISQSNYSRWEHGLVRPAVEKMAQIRAAISEPESTDDGDFFDAVRNASTFMIAVSSDGLIQAASQPVKDYFGNQIVTGLRLIEFCSEDEIQLLNVYGGQERFMASGQTATLLAHTVLSRQPMRMICFSTTIRSTKFPCLSA